MFAITSMNPHFDKHTWCVRKVMGHNTNINSSDRTCLVFTSRHVADIRADVLLLLLLITVKATRRLC